MGIIENMHSVKKAIAEAAKKSGKNADDVILVGITKTFPIEIINEAIGCGMKDVGESRVQEAEKKFPLLSNVRKHFVGHLQTNKVKKAVEISDMIQSVDSLKIAMKINEASLVMGKVMPVLIEVLTDEKKHFGVRRGETAYFLKEISGLEGLRIEGLMTVAPQTENPEDTKAIFRRMKSLFDYIRTQNIPNMEMRYLSMGMSGDFAVAIEEGANIVRVGRGIFGERSNREQ